MNQCQVMRFACSFGGAGGGASGVIESKADLFGLSARVELSGSIDKDAYACKVYEYLTGSEQVCVDIREVTPAMYRIIHGEEAPFAIVGSSPCQGASKLLSAAKSKTAFYSALNELTLVNLRLIVAAYAPELVGNDGAILFDLGVEVRRDALKKLPSFLLFENVPNITSRARTMLKEVRRILTWLGFVQQDGFHECRHVGNLAQRRKRWFMIARNPEKIPAFVYLPPHHPGLVCGDVLNPLPMPGDPAGGPMHTLPQISALNLWRLWKIPAGGDWRDLLPDDGTPRRARFRRHHIEKMSEPSVTIGGTGSNGPCGVADERPSDPERLHHVDPRPLDHALPGDAEAWFHGALGVLCAGEPSGAVIGGASPNSGCFSFADGRPLDLALFQNNPSAFSHKYGVACSTSEAPTITTATNLGEGMACYAAPVKLDLEPQKGNAGRHYDKYSVRSMNEEALTVHSATRVGSGAPSIAQPLAMKMKEGNFHHGDGIGKMGVLPPGDAASAVTGNARIATGPFSRAAAPPVPLDLIPRDACYDKGYAVINRQVEPSNTIACNNYVGCGTYSITDAVPLDLALGCSPRSGAYGVIDEVAPTVIGCSKIDNATVAIADPKPAPPPFVVLSYEQAKRVADGHVVAPFMVFDTDHPDVPLAIVDDMAKPPFRWVETRSKSGKVVRKKEPVTLVLISEDGTWHRPLTTLELAVLQGLEWQHDGKPLDFGGGATKQREAIGNLIPRPVARAFGNQLLAAGLASKSGVFLYGGGGGLWVRPEHADALRAIGVRVVRQQDIGHLHADEMVLLDDGAPVSRKRKKPPVLTAAAVLDRLHRLTVRHNAEALDLQ